MEQASEKAGERRSTPGVGKKMRRSGEGVSEKGEGVGGKELSFPSLASPPSAPYFSHSLPVSFPSRKFLKTPATQAKYYEQPKDGKLFHAPENCPTTRL